MCTFNAMRFVDINYTCLPILSLLSLPKDAVREHSASHGKPFYLQRCYPDVNSDINLREEQKFRFEPATLRVCLVLSEYYRTQGI